ncbi:MAG TPA: glycosyltransferase [Anaerolineales bacterium]|nr:glycosyltransferase [Anaerolineales bacterium]
MGEKQPGIAVVIPSLGGKHHEIEHALALQTRPPDEITVIKGVTPNGRARNQGVAQTSGEILIFIDDDATPTRPELIEYLSQPLLEDVSVGVTGTARVLPRSASWFQRRIAAEIPRTVNPVPNRPLETNPPLRGYGHSLITTTCCAVRRSTFVEAGGFCEDLTSGVDTDFFYRIRKRGYRFLMVPDVYVEHPAPSNLLSLVRKYYWYGIGYGQEALRRPEQSIGPKLSTRLRRTIFLLAASFWMLPNIFFLYSFGYPHLELGFRPLKALSTYAVAWGYASSWRKGAQNDGDH